MKVDGMVKVLLVAIVGLLAVSCIQNMGSDNGERRTSSGSFLGSAAHAAPAPEFIQEGKVYVFSVCGDDYESGKIVNIDRNDGWINVQNLKICSEDEAEFVLGKSYLKLGRGKYWMNLSQVITCYEHTNLKKLTPQSE